jgi:hypothetical protein
MSFSDGGTQRVSASDVDKEMTERPPLPEPSLSVIIYRVFQFHTVANEPYSPDTAVRTEALRERLGTTTDDVREFWRADGAGLAELGAQVGRLVDIGGGGMCVSTTKPLEVGMHVEARLSDEAGGWTYEFPAVVVWTEGDPDPRAGLRFEGMPRRTRLA